MNGVQKFQIHRDDRSTDRWVTQTSDLQKYLIFSHCRLPAAHTCFNQLDLPAYEVRNGRGSSPGVSLTFFLLSDLWQTQKLPTEGDSGVLRRIWICVRTEEPTRNPKSSDYSRFHNIFSEINSCDFLTHKVIIPVWSSRSDQTLPAFYHH